MSKTYLIDDAAEYVGMSRRSFEKLNVSYFEEYRTAKDGKSRKVRVYSESELDLVKAGREKTFKPALVMQTDGSLDSQVATVSDLRLFASLIVETFQQENQKLLRSGNNEEEKKPIDISSFKDKQILNFAQALAYSGLPEVDLKKALTEKKIKGKKTSEKGVWKIYRLSIDEFCRSYFD